MTDTTLIYPVRAIRSYVRRQGRLTRGQDQALTTLWQKFGLSVDNGFLDVNRAFARDNAATVLEIGFGNGQSLLQMAQQQPQTNFIGIEVHQPGVGALLQGIANLGLNNILIYQHDAVEVLTRCISAKSLSKVQIFFPDPWPKTRHHKRRLIQTDFLTLLHSRLNLGGLLHLATDWQDYAQQMLELLEQQPGWHNQSGAQRYAVNDNLRPLTKFEQRGLSLGHGVWDLLFLTTPLT